MGLTIETTAKTNKILAILEPIILPTAISCSPLLTAAQEPANSGRLVPIATTERPTN